MRILVTVTFLLAAVLATAATPTTMNYQGRLTDNTGSQNPFTGTVNITFAIWNDPVVGSAQWNETWNNVSVNDGIFTVLLGSNGTPLPASVFDGSSTLYLALTIEGETLSPRQEIGSTGFAHKTDDSDSLGGLPAANWQRRVTGTCGVGTVISSVNADGTVNCAVEDDPDVGAMSGNDVPRWNGSFLTSGSIVDDGNSVGIGTLPNASYRLDIDGALNVDGFTMATGAADGAVLTADVSGNGTWQAPACNSAFHASSSTDATVPDTSYIWLALNNASSGENFDRCVDTEMWDRLGDGSDMVRRFVAPADGFYHFESAVLWDNANTSEARNAIFLRVNNTDENGNWSVSGGTDFFGVHIAATYQLNAGDTVAVRIYNGDGAPMDTFSQSGKYVWFSGFRIP